MGHTETPDPEFPQAWLDGQRRFWRAWAQASGHRSFAGAEQAWEQACEQWWAQAAGALPAPLAGPMRAALEQTRLCMGLLRGAGDEVSAAALADPAAMFASAMDALHPEQAIAADAVDAAHLRAWQTYVDALSAIARSALERVRARLLAEQPTNAAAVYTIYAEEVEARYREAAGSDAFARIVGVLVNAQVDAMAARARESA